MNKLAAIVVAGALVGLACADATATFALSSPSEGATVSPGQAIDWTITVSVSTGDNLGLALAVVDLVQDANNPAFFDLPAGAVPLGMEDFDRPDGISNPGPGGVGSAYGGTSMGPAGATNLCQIGGAMNTFGVPGNGIGLDYDVRGGVAQGAPQVLATGTFLAPPVEGEYTFYLASPRASVLVGVAPPPAHSPVSAATTDVSDAAFSFIVGPAVCRGDANCDGQIDFGDINAFVDALIHGIYCDGTGDTVDVNGVGGPGFDDINPFVDLLTQNPLPIPCP